MALPLNIDNLITGKTVEYVRIEFKEGWNPEAAMRTTCAFANDINEYGGGYLIIGIAEKDGIPILPPKGLNQNQLDPIQKKFFELCKRIQPNIFPVIEPIEFQGKHIIVIWVTTGEDRPYSAPDKLGRGGQNKIYVRPSSVTVEAKGVLEERLRELAVYKKFDDRINTRASIDDLDLNLILSYLQEVQSDLFEQATGLSMTELGFRLQIARGPEENVRPLNVGLMLFSKNPLKYFEGCFTNVVEFDDPSGTSYSEKRFDGPIHNQIRNLMDYLAANFIKQYTRKTSDTAESNAFFSYPYPALEEVVANALYHRGYENPNPNEIRICKSGVDSTGEDARKIEVLSYPGPLPPVDEQALANLEVTARIYRNIRLGDFLKQLRLVEKYATGIPTIVKSLKENGSPRPILSTDADRTVFRAVIKIHPDTPQAESASVTQVVRMTDLQQSIIESLISDATTRTKLNKRFQENIEAELVYLVENGFLGTRKIGAGVFYYVTPKGISALRSSF